MSISDIAAVAVLLASAASPTRQGFGTPMLAAYFDPATHWQASGDHIRFYPSGSALTQLVSDGFSTGDVVYRAFEVALAAPSVPPQIALGRRATPMVQTLTLSCSSVTVGEKYAITLWGKDGISHGYTYSSTGVPATDAAALAALFTAPNIGTVTVSGHVITITQVSGALTDIGAWTVGNLAVANTTADPGITADLAAIQAANTTGWYGVSLDSNSLAEVKAAAQWVEATGQGGKWGFFDNADLANVQNSAFPVADLNGELEALSLQKTYLQQSNSQLLSFAGFAMASQILALSPGSYALSFKTLPNVVADTDASLNETQQLILNTASTSQPGTGGKNGNWYKTVSGLNLTFPGVTPGGRWVDQGIFADWLQNNVQADLLAYFAGLPKVPLTDIGIAGALAVIKSRLKTGGSPPYGGIDLTRPITVTGPTAASMSQTDRNNRNLSGLSATFFFTGAANTTTLTIVGTP